MKDFFGKLFGKDSIPEKRKENRRDSDKAPKSAATFVAKIFTKKEPRERRREKRYHIGVGCSLKTSTVDAEKYHFVRPRDLSVHGVRFSTQAVFEVGTTVNLYFHFNTQFKGPPGLIVKAKILRTLPPGPRLLEIHYGCEILHEANESKEILTNFVGWLKHANV